MEQYILGLIAGGISNHPTSTFKVEPVYNHHGYVDELMITTATGAQYVVTVDKVAEPEDHRV